MSLRVDCHACGLNHAGIEWPSPFFGRFLSDREIEAASAGVIRIVMRALDPEKHIVDMAVADFLGTQGTEALRCVQCGALTPIPPPSSLHPSE